MKVLLSKDKPLTKNIVIDLYKGELTIPLGKGLKLKYNTDGSLTFMLNGKIHRTDGPAIISEYYQEWYIHNKRHREDGPSVEYSNGDKRWYFHDQLHRTDGPAIEYVNGDKEWFLQGKRHREDGPAIEKADGNKKWFLNGKRVNFETEYLRLLN